MVGGDDGAVGQADAGGPAPLGEDPFDRGAGADLGAPVFGQARDRPDHLHEAPARIEHPVVEIEVAHEVVQARRVVGRSAEEDGRVTQHLLQHGVGELLLDVGREGAQEQRQKGAELAEDVGVGEALEGHIRVVQEP